MATAVSLSHDTFDAALMLGVCDKIVPGLLIGALSFGHLPVLFVPAGPMPSGIPNKQKAEVRQRCAPVSYTHLDVYKRQAQPCQIEAHQLPHRIQPQAAGHDRIAKEMALKKPKIRMDIEFGAHEAFAVAAAVIADIDNTVEHQHRVGRQARGTVGEQLAASAGEQLLASKR